MQTNATRMITAVVVDDEVRSGEALRLLLQKFVPQVTQIAVCTDARQAADLITQRKPDLVFLDIKMPHLSGFEVLQQIRHQAFKVIFTTAFNEFAIKAIRFSAFDYLLKPIDAEELIAAAERYLSLHEEHGQQHRLLDNMLYNLQASHAAFRLAIPSRDGTQFLSPSEIIYCEALSNYTRFYTTGGKQFVTSKTLGDYEDLLLPYRFIRCHKSYIVNKDFIDHINQEGLLVLKTEVRLEVSKRRKAEVLRWMKS